MRVVKMLLKNICQPASWAVLLVICVSSASASTDPSWFANLFKNRSIQEKFNSFFAVKKVIECNIPNQVAKGFCVESEKCPNFGKLLSSPNSTISRLSFVKQLNCAEVSDKSLICCPMNNGAYV